MLLRKVASQGTAVSFVVVATPVDCDPATWVAAGRAGPRSPLTAAPLRPAHREPGAIVVSSIRLWWFFASVFVFAVPFWVLGAVVDSPSWAPMGLPTSGLMFVVPGLVALVLTPRIVGTLAWRLPAYRWWVLVPALLLTPLLLIATELIVAPDAGVPPTAALPVLALAFGVSAAFEELGWTAYATERMLDPSR